MAFIDDIGHKDQIVVFHGTIESRIRSLEKGVRIGAGRPNVDFGPGFYTTLQEEQAHRWARRLALRKREVPVVLEYALDAAALLRHRRVIGPQRRGG